MDITCPEYEAIEATSDYGSRETSGAEADPIMGLCLTEFGRTGIIGCLHRVEIIHNLSFVQMGSIHRLSLPENLFSSKMGIHWVISTSCNNAGF